MTVNNELVRLGDSLIFNKAARLWLPEYVMPEHANSEVPSEKALFEESATQLYPIGAQLARNGGLSRYSLAGAAMSDSGQAKCNYTQIPGKAGNSVHSGYEGGVHADVVASATSFQITDTAALKNEYASALLVVYDETYGFQQYRVIGNDASTGVYTVLYVSEPGFLDAISATSGWGITVYLNPYRNVRDYLDGGGYSSVIGFGRAHITSGYFFWLTTAGPISGVTGAGTWPGQTQYYRGVYNTAAGTVGTYAAGYQRLGYLLGRTASDYGDNWFMLELDREGAL